MERIFLFAYDKVNLGDDLFIRTLTDRYPHTKFFLWSGFDNRQNFADIPNLIVVDQNSKMMRMMANVWPSFPHRWRTKIEKHCDAMIYIGGSIFIEYSNWEQYVVWWKEKSIQKPMYVLGANWGPYSTSEYKNGMANVFASMKDVCFRDLYSKAQFRNVPTVRYAPDILFSFPMPRCQVKKKQVFVSVIDCGGKCHFELRGYEETYLRNMSSIIKQYLEEGCSIILSSFCSYEGDDNAISKLLGKINASKYMENITVLSYTGKNCIEILEAISASDYVIATRFHGVILALAAGRPVLPIVYSDKTLYTLKSIDFCGYYFDLRSDEEFSFESSKENWKKCKLIQLDTIKIDAETHFLKLDSVLD